MMFLDNVLYRRHNTTGFTGKMIMPEMISTILSKALHTHSYKDNCKIKIVVLGYDNSLKKRITAALNKYGKKNKDEEAIEIATCISDSSHLLLLYIDTFNKEDITNDLINIGTIGQNICLTATQYYLGVLWTDKVLCVKDTIDKYNEKLLHHKLCGAILLGEKDKSDSYKPFIMPDRNCIDWR